MKFNMVKIGIDNNTNRTSDENDPSEKKEVILQEVDVERQDCQQQPVIDEQEERTTIHKERYIYCILLLLLVIIVGLAVGLSFSLSNNNNNNVAINTTDTVPSPPTLEPTTSLVRTAACPAEMPEPMSTCTTEDVSCSWGEECCFIPDENGNCNEECAASTSCSCMDDGDNGFIWVCIHSDFCFRPPEMLCDPSSTTPEPTTSLVPTAACPAEMPEPMSTCTTEDLSCSWGEECCFIPDANGNCNEECAASTSCSCMDDGENGFIWVCVALDFCFRPPEAFCIPT